MSVQNIKGSVSKLPVVDNTLTRSGYSADAKATGDAIAENKQRIESEAARLDSELDVEREKIDQIANNQIPVEYLEAAVDKYVEENSAGFATQASLDAVEGELKSDLSDTNDRIDNIVTVEKWNLLEGCGFKEKWYGGTDGVGFQTDGYFVVENVPVEEGTIIITYSDAGYYKSARAISFLDANNNCVGGVEESTSLSTVGITVPVGSVKANVTFGYYTGTTNKPNDYYVCLREKAKINTITLNDEIVIPKIKKESVGIRKPTLSFVFDDGNATDSDIVNIFDGYGFKCAFAILSTIEVTTGKYLEYQANGHEILSHSTDGNIMDLSVTDIASIEAKLKTSKEVLESKGFDIRGWVTPSTDFNHNAFSALCKYYEYGFGHLHKDGHRRNYVHTLFSEDIRQLDRYGLEGSTVEETKAFIDSIINECGYGCFYAHALSTSNNFTRENLVEILDYIKSKVDNGELIVDIPRNAINEYYKLRQYDFPLTNN